MWIADEWKDYELIDAGFGEKLERWGACILRRPDPQAVWPADTDSPEWRSADAIYRRSGSGGGYWEVIKSLPQPWVISYRHLKLGVRLTQFKHTGIFPEQAVNWDWIDKKIRESGRLPVTGVSSYGGPGRNNRPNTAKNYRESSGGGIYRDNTGSDCSLRVLNLFAYTGAATAAAALAGATVCHVDAAKGMVAAAKENADLSGVGIGKARYIVDDVFKFVLREKRRGSRYDAVIMDPPAYGRGPRGELWKSETHLYDAVVQCVGLLSDTPRFFVINTYSTGVSATAIENVLRAAMGSRFGEERDSGAENSRGFTPADARAGYKNSCDAVQADTDSGAENSRGFTPADARAGNRCWRIESGELGLRATRNNLTLPCGCCARWESVLA